MEMKKDYGLFHVGQKILLKKDGKYLFLKMHSGKYDFPGGRIDNDEYTTPLQNALTREIREELGEGIVYTLGAVACQFRRYLKTMDRYVFLTVFEAEYVSGTEVLSDEHAGAEWINPNEKTFMREEFSNEEEYTAVTEYFAQR
ncbi:MAG: NUDIX hydrolase [Patescibacteria group bacterium]|jgi:8-oxo-dGTP pyrophosphatase MutT (NUDIX family)